MNTAPTTISQSIERFKIYLLENDKSLNTIKSYSQDLNYFFKWIQQRYDPPHLISILTSTDLKDYERQLKSDSTIAPSTINRRLISLMKWSEFLVTIGSSNINLANNIKIKKVQRQNNIRWLTRKEVGKLRLCQDFLDVVFIPVFSALYYCTLFGYRAIACWP
ncbi:site-specific integrase [Bacillaceae bacterium W0354]